jgi:hypothetical protein
MIRSAVMGAVLAGVALTGVSVQQVEAQGPPAQDTATLVFDREIFVYPRYDRRNPFRPLLDASESGPLYEQLTLLGIVHSDDPRFSVALFGGATVTSEEAVTSDATGAQSDTTQTGEGVTTTGQGMITYRARRGDILGNMRIIEIQQDRVIVDVTDFGVTDQRVFVLQRGSGGDGP